ncbi:MAG TPA: Maf family nucleotide pyrophosphatase [Nitrobacter sp.]|nr:Maf family nucleotide pyrophosphatase [Nitrobacter sp.]
MTIWRGDKPLILASQSRARQMLLANAGISFAAKPADIDERAIQAASGLTRPGDIAMLLALEKARAVAALHPGRIVLGADQTLVLGERLFDKPAGRAGAAAQLRALSGQTHELHAGIALVGNGRVLAQAVAVARMTVRALTDAAIETYLDAAGEAVTRSVGAYQLEGLGIHLFERIEGDHFTILGLPLLTLLPVLRREGLIAI